MLTPLPDSGETCPSSAARVLLVGSLSNGALSGGVEIGISMILRSPLVQRYGIRLFNTARRPDPHRSLLERFTYNIRKFAAFTYAVACYHPALVHVKASEGVNFFQGVGYCAIARLLQKRVLLQLHGGSFDAWYGTLGSLQQGAVRLGLSIPSEIIVLSEYWETFVWSLNRRTTIHVLPNGVEIEAALPRSGTGQEELLVVTIGALGRRKGHFDIVSAARLLRDEPVRFLLAGPDEFGGETEALLSLARELAVSDQVELLGTLSEREKWQLLARADVFLLPSHNENMPNAALEAMAAGLPVVCTAVGALREMFWDGEGALFVPAGDPAAIASALRRLLASPSLRESMGRRNREQAEERFSFKRVAAKLDAIYQGQKRRSRAMREAPPRAAETSS